MSPSLGTWINRDPIEEEGGNNIYVYAENNPVLWNDYFGLDIKDPTRLKYEDKPISEKVIKHHRENTGKELLGRFTPFWGNPSHKLGGVGGCTLIAQHDQAYSLIQFAKGINPDKKYGAKMTVREHEQKRQKIFENNFKSYKARANSLQKKYSDRPKAQKALKLAYLYHNYYEAKENYEQLDHAKNNFTEDLTEKNMERELKRFIKLGEAMQKLKKYMNETEGVIRKLRKELNIE